MFKKTCWGVKSKETVRFRKLGQLIKALTIHSQILCIGIVPPKGFKKRRGTV